MGKEKFNEAMPFVVDAGGSGTRLLAGVAPKPVLRTGLPPINPSSVGQDAAEATLGATAAEIARAAVAAGTFPAVAGVIASAAVGPSTLARWDALARAALSGQGLSGRVLLTNDMVPLLLGAPLRGVGAVMVAGTGSCVLGAAGGPAVRVGGTEYLGSDEGSAFSLGRMGLVAAVRAWDGRGGHTSVLDRIEKAFSVTIDELARRLAELPYPRTAVAELARHVTGAWLEDGDPFATAIVDLAVGELGVMARRAIEQLSRPASASWVITGGVIAGCDAYAGKVQDEIRRAVGDDASITVLPDCVDAGMSMLLTALGPAGLVSLEVSHIGPSAILEF